MVDPAPLAALATEVARAAGRLLSDAVGGPRTDIGSKSTPTDMVTEVDRASEALIVERLLAARPDDGILAEEGAARDASSGVRWIIDPLDGTTNFLYDHPGYAVSIAAEADDQVVAGVVLDVVHDELYVATLGGGATCNGAPVEPRRCPSVDQALLATGFGYDPDRRRRQAEVLARLLPQVRDIRRMGAASVDLCSVARGRVDAYFERGLAPWDVAAGALIAAEAGAVVTALDGSPVRGDSVLAATPDVAASLGALLTEVGAGDV